MQKAWMNREPQKAARIIQALLIQTEFKRLFALWIR